MSRIQRIGIRRESAQSETNLGRFNPLNLLNPWLNKSWCSEWAVAHARGRSDGGQGGGDGSHDDFEDDFPDVVLFHHFIYNFTIYNVQFIYNLAIWQFFPRSGGFAIRQYRI